MTYLENIAESATICSRFPVPARYLSGTLLRKGHYSRKVRVSTYRNLPECRYVHEGTTLRMASDGNRGCRGVWRCASSERRIFSENVYTLDISNYGARLTGVHSLFSVNETIGLAYGQHRSHFRVRWTGTPGTPKEGQVGLLNLTPERPLWNIALPHQIMDPSAQNPWASEGALRSNVLCRLNCARTVSPNVG